MRNHLLRTIYLLAATAEIEPGAGRAVNDARYATGGATIATTDHAIETSAAEEDENYFLGGYAGI